MANTVSLITYANTFGDWVVVTDQLSTEVNSIGFGNWTKSSGLMTLAGSGTGLQVANNALIQGNLLITGTGTALQVNHDAIISGNLTVVGNTTFEGFEIDWNDITSNTIHANTVTVNTAITGTNAQLNVSNNMVISGNLTVIGNANITMNEIVTANLTANVIIANSLIGQANVQIAQQISDSQNTSAGIALAFSIALG